MRGVRFTGMEGLSSAFPRRIWYLNKNVLLTSIKIFRVDSSFLSMSKEVNKWKFYIFCFEYLLLIKKYKDIRYVEYMKCPSSYRIETANVGKFIHRNSPLYPGKELYVKLLRLYL